MGTAALVGFVVGLVTYPEMLVADWGIKNIVFFLLIGYFVAMIPYKWNQYRIEKHSAYRALRRAFLEVI